MVDQCTFEAPCPRCEELVVWRATASQPYGFTIDCPCTKPRRHVTRPTTTITTTITTSATTSTP